MHPTRIRPTAYTLCHQDQPTLRAIVRWMKNTWLWFRRIIEAKNYYCVIVCMFVNRPYCMWHRADDAQRERLPFHVHILSTCIACVFLLSNNIRGEREAASRLDTTICAICVCILSNNIQHCCTTGYTTLSIVTRFQR